MKREDALKVTCPKCGAPPTMPCMGRRGARKACHVERHPDAWDGRRAPNKGTRNNRCNQQGWVYFIGPVNAECVKIGWTGDHPERRLKQLQTGHADYLHIFGAMAGTQRDEARLHERWKHLHMRGEWFVLDRDLFDFILASNQMEYAV